MNQQDLLKLFDYEPGTGLLYRRSTGKVIGTLASHGYLVVRCQRRTEYVHRIAWILSFGAIPDGQMVDHRNGIRTDNRLTNLRLATQVQQNANRKLESRNKTGHRGIYWRKDRNRWVVTASKDNKSICLGHFVEILDALACREEWEKETWGEYRKVKECHANAAVLHS